MTEDKNQPQRKRIRLNNFEYNTVGAYFVTVCTEGRKCILSEVVREEYPPGQDNHTSAERQTFVGAAIGSPSIDQDNHTSADVQPFVGAIIDRPYYPKLTGIGIIVDDAIQNIPNIYPSVVVEEYVIMPNHIHIILRIRADKYGRSMIAPTISRVVKQMKGYVTKQLGYSIWQRSFYDHVIRDKKDYERLVKYIYENPINWFYDELYSE